MYVQYTVSALFEDRPPTSIPMSPTFYISISVFLLTIFITHLFRARRNTSDKHKHHHHPPPSPPNTLPLFGHLHLLRKPLHLSLAGLARLHGPVLLLRFGSRPVLHVTSLSFALQCLTTHDLSFLNRPRLTHGKYIGYNYTSMGHAPYGPLWRNLRRIATLELLSTHRINSLSRIRSEEAAALAKSLAHDPGRVEMRPRLFALAVNVMMRMVMGKRFYGEGVEDMEASCRFKEIVEETFRIAGELNVGDFVPALKWVGKLGIERRLKTLKKKRDAFLQGVIDQRRREIEDEVQVGDERERRKTMLDVMLSLQKSDADYYTDDIVKGIIMVMLSAGSDTTATAIEWAMSLLLNHPQALLAARAEIDSLVPQGEMVSESHLQDLPYLQAIISETLRLHPAAPLLVPHESLEDCEVEGFSVRRGTMLMINAWAIQRDGSVWEDPTEFKPERFLNGIADGTGSVKMLPFGLGRRRCPGEGLGMRVVGLALATLVRCFEWERVEGDGEVDMREGFGLTMPKAVPLEAICKPRHVMAEALFRL